MILPGTYTGSLVYICGPNELCIGETAPTLTISLDRNKFKAKSLKAQFPEGCDGIFSLKADSIYFSNNCSISPQTDPDVVLQGSYEIRFSSPDSLSFRRSTDVAYPESRAYEYHLKRLGAD